jgi:chorismate synthase
MGSNSFGKIFQITTWGESHGKAIGVVIDGCPAGLELSEADLVSDLQRRAPGSPYTSPRQEADIPQILSGVFEGKTTGAPISIVIYNQDKDSSTYDALRHLVQPGHAKGTYLAKYGIFDHRGSGRASARETACRVAAGAIAKKLLSKEGIFCKARVAQVGTVISSESDWRENPAIIAELERVRLESDSLGGMIEFTITGLPEGLGDPVYEKLDANLAKAMLSIPASKGFEVDHGFSAAAMQGSAHNETEPGLLGGITTGLKLIGKVSFKPTSSIKQLPGARHDPCVALRAPPIVEAMVALVVVDALLLNRCARV